MGEKVLPLILVMPQEAIAASAPFVEKLNRLERIDAIFRQKDGKNVESPAMQLHMSARMIRKCEPMQSTGFWRGCHRSAHCIREYRCAFPAFQKPRKNMRPMTACEVMNRWVYRDFHEGIFNTLPSNKMQH